MKLALIGKKLSHSFSKEIHSKMGLDYSLIELQESELEEFFSSPCFDGFNVTIPYKEKAIKLCDEIEKDALKIGAVNTVKIKNNKTVGYNTDIDGMRYMLKRLNKSVENKNVLILGSGGASKTAQAMCLLDGAKNINVVSRSGKINYENVYDLQKDIQVIINCTPVGTYPNSNESPIDLNKFDNLECVLDCVYNPINTKLILDAKRKNIACECGLAMLVKQALRAQEIWFNQKISNKKVDQIVNEIYKEKLNIVLVGMPSSGKSTVGKILAQKLNKEFIDTDEVIENNYAPPCKLISENGERYFRDIESGVIEKIGKLNGKVIATGGGAVLREQNVFNLKQNAVIIYLDRSLEKLSTKNRPLSMQFGVEELFKLRHPIYNAVSDAKVNNDGALISTVEEIQKIYENISY